ncbi:MAG: hypothetical protein ACNA77_03410 [Opitutales bacterium]
MKFYRWRPHPWHGLEPGSKAPELGKPYGAKKAQEIIRAAMEDYAANFPTEGS